MEIEELERTVASLSDEELAAFRDWFRRFDGERWDCQIEQDARAGRLDALADRAIADHRRGDSSRL